MKEEHNVRCNLERSHVIFRYYPVDETHNPLIATAFFRRGNRMADDQRLPSRDIKKLKNEKRLLNLQKEKL